MPIMALILVHHSWKWQNFCTTSFRITQLMAFVVLTSLVIGTNAHGQFGCGAGECRDDDSQSSGSELEEHVKVNLDFESRRHPFDYPPRSNFHHMRRHDHQPGHQHAGARSEAGHFGSGASVLGLEEGSHYIRGSGSGREKGRSSKRGRSQLLESNTTSDTISPQQEMEALISFKDAISADPLGILRSWMENDSTPCNWTGVSCSSNSSDNVTVGQNYVISVNLTGSQLVGDTDSTLRALRGLRLLERVDLSNNSLTGSMSGGTFANWSTLLSLNMSTNYITGGIPPEVGELVNLKILDFYRNNLTGDIPRSLFNCTDLQILNLGANFLSGAFPELVGRLSRLEVLNLQNELPLTAITYRAYFSGNSFTGTVPASLVNCTSLKVLRLVSNPDLGGEILPILSQLKNLEEIRISYCNFMGSIPAEFGNLTRLWQMSLSYNLFDGHIPIEIGNMRSLRRLVLNDNNFSGVIPTSILNCTELTDLTLQHNELLTGEIPADIGRLTNLARITAWYNRFTGVIPASMSNCTALRYLEICDNPLMDPQPMPSWLGSLPNLGYLWVNNVSLYGPIPKEIGRLSNLVELSFYSNSLTGSLPAELGNLTFLTLAQLGGNQLTGHLPAEIGRLSNLEIFSVGYGLMSGPLPASISNLTQIQSFDVQKNSFSGQIPDFWGVFSQLTELELGRNNFVGSIPEMDGNSSQLQIIDFSSNNLTGAIPPSLGSFPELGALRLSQNRLGGTIPPELASASRLTALDVSGNRLEGSIPSNIGALSSLQHLFLSYNRLDGAVPESLVNCSRLITLDLSHNQFGGRLPAEILSEINTLTYLNLSSNQFAGAWPPEMNLLQNIQELSVSGNSLTGPFGVSGGAAAGSLLSEDSRWMSLVRLDISNNDFAGNIPEFLGSLPALKFFNASYNDFQGPIPDTGIFESNVTEASFLGNPLLCGDILGPGRECRTRADESRSCEGFHCKHVWIPTLCGVVVLVVGMVSAVAIWLCTKTARDKRGRTRVQDFSLSFQLDKDFSVKDVMRIIHQGGENVIGMGSKSVVYMGAFKEKKFAVKVLSQSVHGGGGGDGEKQGNAYSRQREEVLKEVQIMAKLRHRNILRVVGYCSKQGTQALILEYMPGGSLHKHLHALKDRSCRLSWQVRLNIALGIAEGMKYLHHDFPEPLIHGDLKPSNVLLDSTFLPKIADFGISKFVSPNRDGQATASRICGTIGYIPPEYALGTFLSTTGDVYSFGILLLEMLTGRSPASDSDIDFDPSLDYRSWILENYYRDSVSLLDSTLREECMTENKTSEQTRLMLLAALFCTRQKPQSRPTMNDVVLMLIQISEIRLTPSEKKSVEELANAPPDDACTKFWSDEDPNGAKSPVVSTGPLSR